MRRLILPAAAAWLLATPMLAAAAGWSAPTTQTVYTLTSAPYTGATASGLSLTSPHGSKDYPIVCPDGSYMYVPASQTRAEIGVSATASSSEKQKAFFLSTGYARIANLNMNPPTVSGEKRIYIVKGRMDHFPVSGDPTVPRDGMELLGMNVNGTERAVRSTGGYTYPITSGSNSGRALPWSPVDGNGMFTGMAIVGYWRDGSTTRWKVAFWGYQGVDGSSALRSGVATGTGTGTERANVYLPTGTTQVNPTTGAFQSANYTQTTVASGAFYWYFAYTVDNDAFDSWWDGGSLAAPSDADWLAVMDNPNGDPDLDGWESEPPTEPPSGWVTVTVPATPSIDASETSVTAGNFMLDQIADIWDRTWAKVSDLLNNFTDWFWFLKVWDFESGWQ